MTLGLLLVFDQVLARLEYSEYLRVKARSGLRWVDG